MEYHFKKFLTLCDQHTLRFSDSILTYNQNIFQLHTEVKENEYNFLTEQ